MVVSATAAAQDYIEGLNMLANLDAPGSNVPGQWAIQTALGGYQSINDLVGGGRPAPPARPGLRADHRHPGRHLRQAAGALYMFPRLDPAMYPIQDDQPVLHGNVLQATRVMLVQGSGFNPGSRPLPHRFLPHEDDLREAIGRLAGSSKSTAQPGLAA